MNKIKQFVAKNKNKVLASTGLMTVGSSALAFADTTTGGAFVSTADFSSLTSTITDNAKVLIPVGIGVMGVIVVVKLIPKVLYHFI